MRRIVCGRGLCGVGQVTELLVNRQTDTLNMHLVFWEPVFPVNEY